jgi:hypothetical protein
MPALIGGFGEKKSKEISSVKDRTWLGPYLAGLIEGDGSIVVPDPKLTSRRPLIRISFNIKDLPLANKLRDLVGYGRLVYPKVGNYVLWEITDYMGLYVMVSLINGYFRTPKLEALDRLIIWLNIRALNYLNKPENSPKSLDLSPIFENHWLAGFTDADGNFNTIISNRKGTHNVRIQSQFRIELRQTYSRLSLIKNYGTTYYDILSIIAGLLGVNVYNRARLLKETISYSYFFVTSTKRSIKLVRYYFNKFPLLSSKRLDYIDWCLIIDKRDNNPRSSNNIQECQIIKSRLNSKRTVLNWDHLDIL